MPGWRCVLLLLLAAAPVAAELPPLPEPLTLADALTSAADGHPALALAGAEVALARADLLDVDASTGTELRLEGRLRVVEPSNAGDNDDRNDSSARLVLHKRLYDFGYSDARSAAADAELEGRRLRLTDAGQRQQLTIMRRFFDVLLADLAFARDNEDMATAFVAVDRARDRNELGQLSDIELLRLEAAYQEARSRRFASAAGQRAQRARLALAMNRPGQLASELVMPEAPPIGRERPEYESLLADVIARNPGLAALRAESRGAEAAIDAARKSDNPVLHAEVGAGVWNRDTSSTHPLAAGLVLEVPLHSGGRHDAALARARARQLERQAQLAAAEHQLREQVLSLWLDLETLAIAWEQVEAEDAYRDLYLDRSRALYELEVRTDLGDAMVATSAVRLRRAEILFDWMMTQARLRALAGRSPAGVLAGADREQPQP